MRGKSIKQNTGKKLSPKVIYEDMKFRFFGVS
jgi:hypothetical protein